MMEFIIISTIIFADPGLNLTPYLEILPAECPVRIDILARNNKFYDGFAYFSGRIMIFDGNNLSISRKKWVLAHELGHICGAKSRFFYGKREEISDFYAENWLKNKIS